MYFTIFRTSTVYKLSGTRLFSTIYPNYKQNYRLQEWWFDWHYTFIILQSKEYMTMCFLAENTFTLCWTFVKILHLHFFGYCKSPTTDAEWVPCQHRVVLWNHNFFSVALWWGNHCVCSIMSQSKILERDGFAWYMYLVFVSYFLFYSKLQVTDLCVHVKSYIRIFIAMLTMTKAYWISCMPSFNIKSLQISV